MKGRASEKERERWRGEKRGENMVGIEREKEGEKGEMETGKRRRERGL